jgi:hypothetical protein
MSQRGRPPQGPKLVESLDGSGEAKRRLQLMLETVSGNKTVAEACQELGISESRFHEVRNELLQQAVALLEPKPKGRRPAPAPSAEAQQLAHLRAEVQDLKIDLRASQIREEIALVMPHLLKSRQEMEEDAQKKRAPKKPSAPGSAAETNGTPSESKS